MLNNGFKLAKIDKIVFFDGNLHIRGCYALYNECHVKT